jgi:putative addiction module killer protein
MKTLSLHVCQSQNGKAPFAEWFQKLDRAARVKISAALFQMEEGNFSDSKHLSMGVWERRVHSGPGYRIYFAKERDRLIILLGGGTKGTQPSDISRAQALWAYYRTDRNDE